MSNISISLFKPSKNGKPGIKPSATDFYTEMAKIQDGTHYQVISELRKIDDEVKKREYKAAKLQGFTVSAYFEGNRDLRNARPSGLMAIDLDPKGNPTVEDWAAIRDMLFEMPEVVTAFLSASGKGVAFVVKVDPKEFKDTFWSIKDELSDNFDLNIDMGCHDISRLRFVSHDHDLRIRRDFENIPVKHPSTLYLEKKRTKQERVSTYEGEITSADCDRAFNYAEKHATAKFGAFSDGVKHSFLVALAGFANVIGMSEGYLEAEVSKRYGGLTDISNERLLKPIKNVYRTYKHKHNTFVKKQNVTKVNNKIVGEVVTNYVRKGITPDAAQLDEIARKVEANIDQVKTVTERVVAEYKEEYNADIKATVTHFKQFWYMDEDSAVCISKMAFRDYLLQNGVRRFNVGNDWILIQIVEAVVSELSKADLKKIVFAYLEKLKEYEVWETLANRVTSVFADDYLEILPVEDVMFFKDDRDSIRLFYKNGVVRITKEVIDFTQWKEFNGLVWNTQVIEREVVLELEYIQRVKSDFEVFLHNVSKQDDDRFKALTTSIGYLIHSYKDKSNVPAVILNDEVISDEPAGGTGKGIIADCLKHFKNVTVIDGRLWDVKDRFRFQDVELTTDIVFFDDCGKGFPFEALFSIMTEGIQIERKGGLKFRIPFKFSPKFLLSTNYAIVGSGNSNDRRKNELEITQYYSKKFTPRHEFGKLLFDDFTPEEYNVFDNFIFRCCNNYIQLGIVEQTLINQPLKQLYAATDKDFVDYMDEEYSINASAPYKIDQVDAYEKYKRNFPSTKLGSKSFYKFIEAYFKYHNIEVIRRKSGDNRYFYIGGLC